MKKLHGHCLVPWFGFISWLFALAMPMLIYGSNTLFFFLYTWPFLFW
ncbi:inner membrane ygbE domain protein, partial [Shigella sonnei 53G]